MGGKSVYYRMNARLTKRPCSIPRGFEKGPNEGFCSFPKRGVAIFGCSHKKDNSILGSILGTPYLGKVLNVARCGVQSFGVQGFGV